MTRTSALQRTIVSVLAVVIAVPVLAVSPSVPQLPEPGRASMSREDGLLAVWFSKLLLGHLDPTTVSFHAARSGGVEAGQPE